MPLNFGIKIELILSKWFKMFYWVIELSKNSVSV